MNIEAIDSVDAERQALFGVFLNAAGWCGKNGHVNILQFFYRFNNLVISKFCWFISGTVAAHNTGKFHIRRCKKRIQSVVANVSVANNRNSNLFHFSKILCHKEKKKLGAAAYVFN